MSLSRALERIDRWLALSWWYEWRLDRAERQLAKALDAHGEKSFQAAAAAAAVSRAQFAIDYGRNARPEVQAAVRRAAIAGVPTHILRLMVVNLDVRVSKGGSLFVRRAWWLTALAWVARLLVIAAMALSSAQVIAFPVAWPWKVLLLALYAVIFAAIAYVWDLFGVRAVRATRRFAEHFEATAQTTDDVTSLVTMADKRG
jgi:hypothetical protein